MHGVHGTVHSAVYGVHGTVHGAVHGVHGVHGTVHGVHGVHGAVPMALRLLTLTNRRAERSCSRLWWTQQALEPGR